MNTLHVGCRKLCFAAAAGLLLTGMAACGSGATSGGGNDTIKIGSLHPLTGDTAIEGQGMDIAVKMAVDDINASGGIKSLGGRKLEVISADTKGDPSVGQTAAQRMLDQGVTGLIGAYNTSVTTNVVSVAQRAQIPLVIDVAAGTAVIPPNTTYAFRLQPTGAAMGVDGANFIKAIAEKNGHTVAKVAVLHEKSNFGTDVTNSFKQQAQKLGIEVGLVIPYDAATVTNLTTELTQVKAYHPDVLVVSGYYNDGVLIAQNAAAVQPDVQAIVGVVEAAYDQPQFPHDAPNVSNGIYDVNYHYNATSQDSKALRDRFLKANGKAMRTTAVYSYESTLVLADALERASSTDPKKLRTALAQTELKQDVLAFSGPIKFGPDGEDVNAKATLMQVRGQEVPQVFPEAVAEKAPIWPAVPWKK